MISYAIKFWFQGKTDGQTSQVFTTLAFAWLLLKISLTDSHTAVKLQTEVTTFCIKAVSGTVHAGQVNLSYFKSLELIMINLCQLLEP